MASNELIDDIISQQAFAQVDKMKGEMEALTDKFLKAGLGADALNKAITGSNISTLSSNIQTATQATTQYIDAGKQILELQKKIALATSAEGEEIAKLRLQLQALNASNKDRVKDSQAEEGSINSLRVRLKELQKGYDDMGKAMRDSFKGQTLVADIQKVDAELKKLEGGSGRFQRNVGNYSNATFQLSQSLRELPAFAFSAQTGILALSNNLPMLVDSFNQVKASTGSAGSALAVFGRSIFTFTNLFTIALGLFTVFYQDIMQFVGVTKKGSEAMDSFKKSSADASGEIAKLTIQVFDFHKGIASKESVLNTYNNSMGKLYGEAKNVLEVEESLNKNAETYIKYTGLKAKAVDLLAEAVKTYNENSELQKKDDWWTTLKAQASTMFKDIASGGQITFGFNALKNPSYALSQYKKAAAEEAHTAMLAFADIQRQIDEMEKNKPFGTTKKAKPKKEQEVNHIEELKKEFEVEKALLDRSLNEKVITQEAYYEKLSQLAYKYVGDRKNLTKEEKQDEIIWNDELVQISVDSYLKLSKMLADRLKEVKDGDIEMVKSALKAIEAQAKAFDKFNKWRHNAINDLKNAQLRADDDIAKSAKRTSDQIREVLDAKMSRMMATIEFAQAAIFALGTAFEIQNEIEIAALDRKSKANERYYEDEVLRVKASGKTKQEQEKELIKLEAQKASQHRSIERERAVLARRQAKRQKVIDIAQITANTILAVTGALARFKNDGYIAYFNAAALGIVGAAQIARVAATPLPEFAKGTDSSPEGYAIVGEKGTELVTDPSGKSWLTPAKDTITYLKKGSKVTTNEKLMEMVKNSAYVQLANLNTPVTSDMYSKTLVEQFETLTSEFKALKGVMQDKAMSVQIQGNYDHYIHVRNNIR